MDESRGLTALMMSPDGHFWWDGARWLPISDDGRWRWSGTRWLLMESTPSRPGSSPGRPGVDLLVCFDTTGSMSDKIAGLVAQTSTFVQEAATRQLDLRWGLIAFGDLRVPGDRIETYPFTAKPGEFTKSLRGMPRFSGGANTGETSLDALSAAAQHAGWRADAVRMCILITDEPPVGAEVDLETVGQQLRAEHIVVFCVSPDHRAYRWVTKVTGGEWWDIFERVPFERLLERLAGTVMTLAARLVPQLGSGAAEPRPGSR
jgi:von Willebrand factor type A domain